MNDLSKTTLLETIWKKKATLEGLNTKRSGTLVEHLNIRIVEIGNHYLVASMPVDERTIQPMGILHGGASIALAETVGSIAANLAVDDQHYCVGLEVNGNHLKSALNGSGNVYAKASPVHLGRSTQVWQIKIVDENEKDICISRLTMAVLSHSQK